MSFGWSAGDIAIAVKFLCKVTIALKEAGGAKDDFQDTTSFLKTLTQTLEHLIALQNAQLDQEILENLRDQCDQIKGPVNTFLSDVEKYEHALGVQSTMSMLRNAPRKLQWALFSSKKATVLKERIAVPMAAASLILGKQTV